MFYKNSYVLLKGPISPKFTDNNLILAVIPSVYILPSSAQLRLSYIITVEPASHPATHPTVRV